MKFKEANRSDERFDVVIGFFRSEWRLLTIGLLALLGGYGIGSHHIVMVALGLLALLAFNYRSDSAQQPQSPKDLIVRSPDQVLATTHPWQGVHHPHHHPSVADGGSMERAHLS